MRLQNIKTKDFLLKDTVVGLRESDDQKILSYNILTDRGYETTRHRRFLRPLLTDEEITEKAKQNAGSNVTGMISPQFHKTADSSDDVTYSADAPRRSGRLQKAKDSSLRPPAPPLI